MPQNIKEGLQGHSAGWYSDVFDLVFPNLDKGLAGKLWKKQLAEEKRKRDDDDDEGDD